MMSKPVILRQDTAAGYQTVGEFAHYDEAMKKAVKLFDDGVDDDFHIIDSRSDQRFIIRAYTLVKDTCPICGKTVRRYQMERTRDCHGIPYRMVCGRCYDRIMDSTGYDGEEYDEADECLDTDY